MAKKSKREESSHFLSGLHMNIEGLATFEEKVLDSLSSYVFGHV